jgi:hypothetical protein
LGVVGYAFKPDSSYVYFSSSWGIGVLEDGEMLSWKAKMRMAEGEGLRGGEAIDCDRLGRECSQCGSGMRDY